MIVSIAAVLVEPPRNRRVSVRKARATPDREAGQSRKARWSNRAGRQRVSLNASIVSSNSRPMNVGGVSKWNRGSAAWPGGSATTRDARNGRLPHRKAVTSKAPGLASGSRDLTPQRRLAAGARRLPAGFGHDKVRNFGVHRPVRTTRAGRPRSANQWKNCHCGANRAPSPSCGSAAILAAATVPPAIWDVRRQEDTARKS